MGCICRQGPDSFAPGRGFGRGMGGRMGGRGFGDSLNFIFFSHIFCVDLEIFNHESLCVWIYPVALTLASFSFIILLISITVIFLT